MEERRHARIGTVTGLALLAGGTAVAAVAGGAHSVFATVLLGLLTFGLGHSLLVEIRRQARRLSPGWTRQDTTNAILLGIWAETALIMTILETGPGPARGVGLTLSLGYAAGCGYFVTERRRAIAIPLEALDEDQPSPATDGSRLIAETQPARPTPDPAAGEPSHNDRTRQPADHH